MKHYLNLPHKISQYLAVIKKYGYKFLAMLILMHEYAIKIYNHEDSDHRISSEFLILVWELL